MGDARGLSKPPTICYNIIEVIKMSRAAKIDEKIYCPKCGKHEHQVKHGKNKSGSQKYHCNDCNIDYTPEPYPWQYSEEVREQAIKTYHSGVSGRKVGLLNNFSKSNVYNWIKKRNK